ncbi:MAG: VCBS repeat-containing protein [Verrucomicrobiae bacterium]|nr:VCBS repeat-containing protein [Verrucomicrobiae bacterium]
MQLVRNFLLLSAVCALLSACDKGAAPSATATAAQEAVSSTASVSQAKGASEPEVAVEADIVTAPGLQNMELFSLLADSYGRIDPAKDGWDSEAFSAAANGQLQRLAKYFEDMAAEAFPDGLASDQFVSSELRPAEQSTVFDDGSLKVTRAVISGSALVHKGIAGIDAALSGYLAALGEGAVHPHLKLKLFKVDANRTEVIAQATAEQGGGRVQLDANWVCAWDTSTAGGSDPLLVSIDVLKHSETRYSGSSESNSLFQDCTEAVLGKTDSYRQQLLHSTDYWRLRIQRDIGLDVVANHGLAVGDVNGDLLDDLYICQQGGLPNRLYIQQPDGSLRDATDSSGTGWLDYCASALFVDFDNDGDRDLAVGQESRLLLMENDGTGKFQLSFGISSRSQTFSIAAADYDADGDVDLFACGYNPFGGSVRRGAMGQPMPYHDAQNGGPNMLLRNDGNWEFNDATEESGLEHNNNRYAFAAAFEDYDNDGNIDLYVANDYGRNNLYRQDNGKFTDVADELGVEDMSSGMSVSWADVNHDGFMDLYVSNMFSAAGNRITYQRQFKDDLNENTRQIFQRHARGNSLFMSDTKGGFKDMSVAAGVTMGRWAWSSRFVDFNNDGWEDIVVANGFISTEDNSDL